MPISDINLLAEEAFAWTAARAVTSFQPTTVDPADRFLIRSASQKSVRRGQQDRAAALMVKLHRLDPAYAWRTALTIAVEDVGFGCPEAVLWGSAATAKAFRDQVGEVRFLVALTVEMCRSLKSRAGVETSWLADERRHDLFRAFGSYSRSQLLGAVEAADPQETYAALSVLRGIVPPGLKLRAHDPHGVAAACEIISDHLPARHARAAIQALVRPLDGMSLAYFPSARMAQTAPIEIVSGPFPPGRLIRGFGAEAFDQHERLGRQAIHRFTADLLATCTPLANLGASTARKAVADAVFVVEGQALNRWIAGGQLTALRNAADSLSLTRHGLPDEEGESLCRLVLDQIEVLHDHRAAVVLEAARQP